MKALISFISIVGGDDVLVGRSSASSPCFIPVPNPANIAFFAARMPRVHSEQFATPISAMVLYQVHLPNAFTKPIRSDSAADNRLLKILIHLLSPIPTTRGKR